MNHIGEYLHFFRHDVSCFFKEFLLNPLWDKYNNHTDNIWDSLAVFLEAYAFEHQQRKPDYLHASVDALFAYREQGGDLNQNDAARNIWELFTGLLNNQGLNEQNNPLCPQGTDYQRRDGRIYRTNQRSVIQLVSNNTDIQNNSLTAYLKDKIVGDCINEAWGLLKSIQGVNSKIASLFLRDITYIMGIDLNEKQNRHQLQPIDIWVRRTVKTLTNNQQMSDLDIAKWIFNKSQENAVTPELVNMGIWYFGAQVATSEYRLTKALNDINYANTLFAEHREQFKRVCHNCLNME